MDYILSYKETFRKAEFQLENEIHSKNFIHFKEIH
jgi:hypothetical protein